MDWSRVVRTFVTGMEICTELNDPEDIPSGIHVFSAHSCLLSSPAYISKTLAADSSLCFIHYTSRYSSVAFCVTIQRYNWEDDYIRRTWYRDPLYIIVGLAVLAATGTLLELSGTPLGGVSRRKTETIPTSVLLRRISSFAIGSLHSPCKHSQTEREDERGSAAAPVGPRRCPQHVAS